MNIAQLKLYSKRYDSNIGLKGQYYLSKKLSGTRAIWTGRFFVDRALMPIDQVPRCFTDLFPSDTPLDGVLQGISYDYRYPTDWDTVTYTVFDYPKQNMPFRLRLDFLKKCRVFRDPSQKVKLIDYTDLKYIQHNFNMVNREFKKALEEGQRGVMLIQADSNYEGKQVPHLLEYSEKHTGTGRIIQFLEGTHKTHKMLGKYKCITKKGKYFFVGKGIPDDVRRMYQFTRTKCIYVDPKAPQIGDTLHFESNKMLDSELPVDPHFVWVDCVPKVGPKLKTEGEKRRARRGRRAALKRNPKNN